MKYLSFKNSFLVFKSSSSGRFFISFLKQFLLFSLSLQMCRPMAHTDQEDVSSVQTARYPQQPWAVRVWVWDRNWRTWRGRRSRGWRRLGAHSSASTLQPGVTHRKPWGLFSHHHYNYRPVPHLPCTLQLTHPRLWRLLLTGGGHRLRKWWHRRGQAPLWWWHSSAHW